MGAGPIYESQEQKDGGLVLKISKFPKFGLYAFNGLTGFEIWQGKIECFYSADPKLLKENVFVKNDQKVVNMVPICLAKLDHRDLFNTIYYPVNASFKKTDNWE